MRKFCEKLFPQNPRKYRKIVVFEKLMTGIEPVYNTLQSTEKSLFFDFGFEKN